MIKANIYSCELCNFNTKNRTGYMRHLDTKKHKNNCNSPHILVSEPNKGNPLHSTYIQNRFICNSCEKGYDSRAGLWFHTKKCKCNDDSHKSTLTKNESSVNEIVMELIKQNQEFKNLLMEQNSKIVDLSNKTTIINNTNSNNFNLNVFLNEKCKDAMNIMDFVNELNIGFNDLENVGRLGYVEGISRIFLNGLKQLDVYKRPIHCTDIKRETLYVKDNNKWDKDDEKDKIKKAISKIAFKNTQKIPEWNKLHPDSDILDTPTYKEHLQIMMESIGGLGKSSEYETNKSHEKIIKNIVRNVFLDKSSVISI